MQDEVCERCRIELVSAEKRSLKLYTWNLPTRKYLLNSSSKGYALATSKIFDRSVY